MHTNTLFFSVCLGFFLLCFFFFLKHTHLQKPSYSPFTSTTKLYSRRATQAPSDHLPDAAATCAWPT